MIWSKVLLKLYSREEYKFFSSNIYIRINDQYYWIFFFLLVSCYYLCQIYRTLIQDKFVKFMREHTNVCQDDIINNVCETNAVFTLIYDSRLYMYNVVLTSVIRSSGRVDLRLRHWNTKKKYSSWNIIRSRCSKPVSYGYRI